MKNASVNKKGVVVVVAQPADRLLLSPEVCGSGLVIGEFFKNIYLLSTVPIEKMKIKKKRPGMPIFKKRKDIKNVEKLF